MPTSTWKQTGNYYLNIAYKSHSALVESQLLNNEMKNNQSSTWSCIKDQEAFNQKQ